MDDATTRAADRQLGWLISLCGVVLIAGHTLPTMDSDAFASWWNVGGIAVLVIVALLAAAGRVLPYRVLRVGWVAAPTLGAVLFATSFVAYQGADAGAPLPWIWTVEPVLVSYLVLWLRPLPAMAGALLSACLPGISGLVVLGSVPQVVAAGTPAHLSNLVFVAICLGVRGRLIRLGAIELRAEERELEQARTQAEAERRDDLARLVHDQVLSVFTVAMAASGPASEPLRTEAGTALTLLDRVASDDLPTGSRQARPTVVGTDRHDPPAGPHDPPARSGSDKPVTGTGHEPPQGVPGLVERRTATGRDAPRTGTDPDTRAAAAELIALVRSLDPDCHVRSAVEPGTVPAAVVDAVRGAAAEALRNSVRHAGPDATRRVELRVDADGLRLTLRDDGRGFDPDAVDPARLGVRSSVLARMRSLEGGRAEVTSAPGAGTEVVLEWVR